MQLLRQVHTWKLQPFKDQRFITPGFKKTTLVSHGFQTSSNNFEGTIGVMYMIFTLVPNTIQLQFILIFELQHIFIV